jgi:hypothetical protein
VDGAWQRGGEVEPDRDDEGPGADEVAAVDLYWLPLGAGQRVVRRSGRLYERLVALVQRRAPLDLYHAALEVTAGGVRSVIELAPVPDGDGIARGVVAQGAVGSRWLGRWRVFRYELRCWVDGVLPDREYAVDGPRRLSSSPDEVARLVALLPTVPTLVWGRDEARAGEMWNSNSVIAWLLVRSSLDVAGAELPPHGRAPGWTAGIAVAGGVRGPHPS